MKRAEAAIGFLQMLAANKVREAYNKYISPDFIHHNQYFKGDRESLLLGMEQAHAEFPHTHIEVKQVIEEGEKVMLMSHVKHQPQDLGFAVVHIFRFKDSQIVEMWDLGQEIIPDSPNEKGIF